MLGVNNLMYNIHICIIVLYDFYVLSRSSLVRIPALGVGGKEVFLLLDALRGYFLIFGLQDQSNVYTIMA